MFLVQNSYLIFAYMDYFIMDEAAVTFVHPTVFSLCHVCCCHAIIVIRIQFIVPNNLGTAEMEI